MKDQFWLVQNIHKSLLETLVTITNDKVRSDLPETLGYAHQRQEKPNTERMETQRMAQHFKMILSGVPETLF